MLNQNQKTEKELLSCQQKKDDPTWRVSITDLDNYWEEISEATAEQCVGGGYKAVYTDGRGGDSGTDSTSSTIGSIVSQSFASYRNSLAQSGIAAGSFILRSLIMTRYNDDGITTW